MIKAVIMVTGSAMALYALVLAAFYLFQGKMIFFPGLARFGDCPDMEGRGAKAESFGDIRYYIQKSLSPEQWIIIFHGNAGNAGNACDRAYFLDLLEGFPANRVVFEYPGFGRDGKKPGESVILEGALVLVRHIRSLDPGLPVYLMGESLGTGVAAFVASQTPVDGLILVSAYPSLARVARHHYPWLPVHWLMKHRFEASAWAGETPALLFHGAADDIIPIRFAREQLACFKGEKSLVEIPGAGHNDITDAGAGLIREKIRSFITQP
nr:alpha/beta hydrolase [Desulfobacula sp.]